MSYCLIRHHLFLITMKKLFLFTILALSLVGCKSESEQQSTLKNKIIISGKISGFEDAKELAFFFKENEDTSIIIQSDQNFSLQVPFYQKSYFYFQLGKEYGTIFASPGDSIHIQLQYHNFDESLKFSGDKQNENNYLIANYLYRVSEIEDEKILYQKQFLEFKNTIAKIHNGLTNMLNHYESLGIDEQFKTREQIRNQLFYYKKIIYFPVEYKHYTNKQAKLPDSFFEEIENIITDEEQYLQFHNYPKILMEKLSLQQPILNKSSTDYPFLLAERIKTLENEKVRDALYYKLMSKEVKFNSSFDSVQRLYHDFSTTVNNDSLQQNVLEYFSDRKEIMPGKKAADIQLTTGLNEQLQLSGFEGKLVYIDFWATWCKPCREEIPFFNQLTNKYAKNNIVFLAVSLDKDQDGYSKWKSFLDNHEMTGIQTIALNNPDKVIDNFHIYSIPRYVFIDKNGNIITAFAPKPSEKNAVHKLIEQHL